MPDYYNTNREEGKTLAGSILNAKSQQDLVLEFFEQYPGIPWPPHKVWEHVFTHKVPLTSVRRAITNLTVEGKLEKTSARFMGTMGKMVFGWALTPKKTTIDTRSLTQKGLL